MTTEQGCWTKDKDEITRLCAYIDGAEGSAPPLASAGNWPRPAPAAAIPNDHRVAPEDKLPVAKAKATVVKTPTAAKTPTATPAKATPAKATPAKASTRAQPFASNQLISLPNVIDKTWVLEERFYEEKIKIHEGIFGSLSLGELINSDTFAPQLWYL